MPFELQDLEAEMLCDQTEPPGQEPSILDPRLSVSAQDLKDDKSLVETIKEKISDAYDAVKEKTSEITDKNPKVDQIHTGETVVDKIQHIAEETADKVEDMTEASKDYLSAIDDSPKERRYNDTRESDDSCHEEVLPGPLRVGLLPSGQISYIEKH